MTAVNVLFDDRAIVWTDGVSYDDDATILAFANKVQLLPQFNAALVVRGPTLLGPLVAMSLSEQVCAFDDAVEVLASCVAETVDQATYALSLLPGASEAYQAILVGRSESRGFWEAHFVGSDDPTVAHQLSAITFSPGDGTGIGDRIAAEVPNVGQGPLITAEVGLRVMEMQRDLRIDGKGGVGGFAQATILSASGAMTQVLRRWPDRVGEKLGGAAC